MRFYDLKVKPIYRVSIFGFRHIRGGCIKKRSLNLNMSQNTYWKILCHENCPIVRISKKHKPTTIVNPGEEFIARIRQLFY